MSTLGALPPRSGAAVASSVDGAGIIALGGVGPSGSLDDGWRLRWDARLSTDESCRAADDLDADGLAGCEDPDCTYRCTSCGNGVCEPDLEVADTCPADCM